MPNRDDKAAIDALTAAFFRAFSTLGGRAPAVDTLYELFIPQAVIVNTAAAQTYDVAGFVEPRRAILTNGSLLDFNEEELSETTSIAGNIAQRFSRYGKSWIASGRRCEGTGTKSLQFVRAGGTWKIASLVWDDD
jgi:hypothetical protein